MGRLKRGRRPGGTERSLRDGGPALTSPTLGGHDGYLHRAQRTDSKRELLLRFGAVAGVIFGLSRGVPGIIEAFTGETAVTSFVVGPGIAAFGLPALFAFYGHQTDVAGRFGAVAFAVNAIGSGCSPQARARATSCCSSLRTPFPVPCSTGRRCGRSLAAGLICVVGTVLFGASWCAQAYCRGPQP